MRILGGPCDVGSEPGPHKTGKVGMCVCVCVCVSGGGGWGGVGGRVEKRCPRKYFKVKGFSTTGKRLPLILSGSLRPVQKCHN